MRDGWIVLVIYTTRNRTDKGWIEWLEKVLKTIPELTLKTDNLPRLKDLPRHACMIPFPCINDQVSCSHAMVIGLLIAKLVKRDDVTKIRTKKIVHEHAKRFITKLDCKPINCKATEAQCYTNFVETEL